MHYQIFLPDVAGSNPKLLGQFGIESLATDQQPVMIDLRAFAGTSRSGVLLNWWKDDPSTAPNRYMANWNWIPCDKYWLGTNPDSPPHPDELERTKTYPGNYMTLLDGREWKIPAYTQFDHSFQLVDGKIARRPAPQWDAYIKSMQVVQREIFGALDLLDFLDGKADRPENASDKPTSVKITDGLYIACEALAVNYRINAEIACALGLLDDHVLSSLLCSAIELPEIMATRGEKKNGFHAVIPVT